MRLLISNRLPGTILIFNLLRENFETKKAGHPLGHPANLITLALAQPVPAQWFAPLAR